MQNEKQVPFAREKNGRNGRRIYWRRSLVFLMLPAIYSQWGVHAAPKNDDITPSASVLSHAHSHNDYRQDRPLREALMRGFASVEADVHLVGGELYLGHWMPQVSRSSTLLEAYLEPLNALMTRQNGKVYGGYDGVFYLMIDVKTDSLATYKALRLLLLQYPVFQCNPHFQVFISGNRAIYHILKDEEQVMALDGRLPDLDKPVASAYMPVISDNFRKYFKWRGKGPMPASEMESLKIMTDKAHRQGKKLRFWSIPDQSNVWETLLNAGVDLINTNDLQGLQQFFSARGKPDLQEITNTTILQTEAK